MLRIFYYYSAYNIYRTTCVEELQHEQVRDRISSDQPYACESQSKPNTHPPNANQMATLTVPVRRPTSQNVPRAMKFEKYTFIAFLLIYDWYAIIIHPKDVK